MTCILHQKNLFIIREGALGKLHKSEPWSKTIQGKKNVSKKKLTGLEDMSITLYDAKMGQQQRDVL